MLGWYRELIALRHSVPDFVSGDVKVEFDEDAGWLLLRRGRFLIASSMASDVVRLDVPSDAEILLRSSEEVLFDGDGLVLIPDSVAVFRVG